MDAVCCPLFLTATCSFEMFSHFLDLFDVLGSPQPTCLLLLLLLHYAHVSSHLILPLPSPLPPPLLPSWRGVPAEDHCLRSEGPLIAGLGTCSGVHQINPTDSNIWFPLCLMKMLAFHMQPNRLDQICSIDLDAREARAQATRTHVYHSTVHITQIHMECLQHTHTNTSCLSKTPLKM